MKCTILTFWQYILIGTGDFFRPEPRVYERTTVKVIRVLWSILVAILIIGAMRLLGLIDVFERIMVGFLAVAVVVDVAALVIFLVISWRKAVRDCWDKFPPTTSSN